MSEEYSYQLTETGYEKAVEEVLQTYHISADAVMFIVDTSNDCNVLGDLGCAFQLNEDTDSAEYPIRVVTQDLDLNLDVDKLKQLYSLLQSVLETA